MLNENLGEAKRLVRNALAALDDASKELPEADREAVVSTYDRMSDWALDFFNTHAEIAARSHDGKLSSFAPLTKLQPIVAGLAETYDLGPLKRALLHVDQALELLKKEESLGELRP